MADSKTIFDRLFETYPALDFCRNEIYKSYNYLRECYRNGGKVLVCGNGGSAADADHIVGELMKGFLLRRPVEGQAFNHDRDILSHLQGGLPAISLNAHAALLSAFANDEEFDYAYAQQAYAYGNADDVLIALSTSGNSASVVNAVRAAGAGQMISVGITGRNRSQLSDKCTVCIRLPETETYRVQELTLPVYHCLCAMLEADFFEA
jgi:D-sedoheptulose 7-phosphate isomerase